MKRLGIVSLLMMAVGFSAAASEPQRLASDLSPARPILVDGLPLDVQRNGQANPAWVDFDRDGLHDLLVGQFENGRVRLYRNVGTQEAPKFADYEFLLADGKPIEVPVGCCIGFTPRWVDLDADGHRDLLSGSDPGQIYWFRGRADGTFASGEKVRLTTGKELSAGTVSTAFPVDWDTDGRLDLVLGNSKGEIHLARNASTSKEVRFSEPQLVELSNPLEEKFSAAVVASDWDADGRFDLVIGFQDGSVAWFRNTSSAGEPTFAPASCLVPPCSEFAIRSALTRGRHETGRSVKPWVADYNNDGRVDLLLGDFGGTFTGKPRQLPSEVQEEQAAHDALPALREQWSRAFTDYRRLQNEKDQPTARIEQLLAEVTSLKSQIDAAEATINRHRVQNQTHGYVWVFLRRDGTESQQTSTQVQ